MTAIPNPHYIGAPARMADGRLFTEYRPNCQLLPPLDGSTWQDHNRRAVLRNGAATYITDDRRRAVLRAGSAGCVDTMVPEVAKRIAGWNGCEELAAQPVGIGTGRLYLSGRPDLATADPDRIAAATIPSTMLHGTFPHLGGGAIATPTRFAVLPPIRNRFSLPYAQ